jgi:FKBP-type peptidyl-prolyl cis-trans isomerase
MTQTMKGQNNTPQKRGRPGQRQQERLLRQGRRRRRIRQWTAAIVALVLIVLGVVGVIEYQQYTAAQTAAANKIKDQHATATARVQATSSAIAGATATSVANATATVQARASATAFAQAIRTATAGSPTPSAGPASPPPVTGTPVKLPDGLQYLDIKVGPGPVAKQGSTLQVEYTGWLQSNGQKFDSSYDRGGQPFTVSPLGQAQVIQGWNEGLIGIRAGGTRRLIIPAALAYGSTGQGSIPPNATLIFDVTAVTVQ